MRSTAMRIIAIPSLSSWQNCSTPTLLAVALRYPKVATSWIMHLPEMSGLKEQIKQHLSPADFVNAWKRGEQLALEAAITEVPPELTNARVNQTSLSSCFYI